MALFHRFGTEEDEMECPLEKAVSKEMLCTRFNKPLNQNVYIFHNDHTVTLELEESYFIPTEEGKYVVVFENDENNSRSRILLKDMQVDYNNTDRKARNPEVYANIPIQKATGQDDRISNDWEIVDPKEMESGTSETP